MPTKKKLKPAAKKTDSVDYGATDWVLPTGFVSFVHVMISRGYGIQPGFTDKSPNISFLRPRMAPGRRGLPARHVLEKLTIIFPSSRLPDARHSLRGEDAGPYDTLEVIARRPADQVVNDVEGSLARLVTRWINHISKE